MAALQTVALRPQVRATHNTYSVPTNSRNSGGAERMAELPGIERETLDVDVVIVGAGPAGLAAAYRLAELIKAHNESRAEKKLEGLSIAVLEKGKEIGSHGISGAVMDPRGIAELMPDWLERGCPIESPVTDDAFWYLFEKFKIAAPIMPPPLQNHGNYVVSLGEFVRWMAPIVGEMGVDLFPEFAGVARAGGGRARRRRPHRRQGHRQERSGEAELRAGRRHPGEGHDPRRGSARHADQAARRHVRSVRGKESAGLLGRREGAVAASRRSLRARHA